MHWNHRLINVGRDEDEGIELYSLAEVFYDDDGSLVGYTTEGVLEDLPMSAFTDMLAERLARAIEAPALRPDQFDEAPATRPKETPR